MRVLLKVSCFSLAAFCFAIVMAGCGDNSSQPAKSGPNAGAGGGQQSANSSCGKTSWIGGITELCGGHLVYRDYIYDDHGAASLLSPVALPPYAALGVGSSLAFISAGSARYPAGADNTADLVRLELWLEGEVVEIEFELNTLYTEDQTIAAIAIDSDNNPETGEVKLLGLTVAGADEVHVFETADPSSNLIKAQIPKPAGSHWKLWAVTAQANGTVMNVAFRGVDETAALGPDGGSPLGKGMQFEDKQAAALMAGNISDFSMIVAVADLKNAVTRGMAVPPGFHQRVYTSQYTLPPGEGVNLEGIPGRHGATLTPCEQYFNFLGKYQPYAIYIPDQPGPHGVQLRMHGCEASPVLEVNQANYQQRFCEDLNVIIASPLGRGAVGWYSDISERDALDVMADVIDSYEVDEDRVLAAGTSMGGYGALRMAALYPDRFAAGTNWVGFPGNFINTPLPLEIGPLLDSINAGTGGVVPLQSNVGSIGNMMDYTGNFKHVPFVHLYATADELVHVTSSLAFGLRLTETPGIEFDFYEHAPAEHLSFVFFDDWQKEAAFTVGRTLVKNPAHIMFRTDAYLDYPEYDIKHDKAYWVSDIVAREVGSAPGEAYSDLDVRSFGCGLPEKQFVSGQDGGVGPVPWIRLFNHVVDETPVPADNRLVASLVNVTSLSIDTDVACLSSGTTYQIETDGPVAILFSDGRVLNLPDAGVHEGII